MSLYNMVNGVNLATFYILPMLGKHPDEYPRFRDCFLADEDAGIDGKIIVYTRTGGGNRDDYCVENDDMCAMPTFLQDYDDEFDPTFACWVFDVPVEWQADYDLILAGETALVSDAYVALVVKVYPKIADKLKEAFGRKEV